MVGPIQAGGANESCSEHVAKTTLILGTEPNKKQQKKTYCCLWIRQHQCCALQTQLTYTHKLPDPDRGSHITLPFPCRTERQLTAGEASGVPRKTSLQSDLGMLSQLPLSKDSPFPQQEKKEISQTVPTAAFLKSSQQQKDVLNPIAEVTALSYA